VKNFVKFSLVLAVLTVVVGCSSTPADSTFIGTRAVLHPTYQQASENGFTAANRAAIAALVKGIDPVFRSGPPILVATVVNLNNLSSASPLGRIISEQFSSAMVSNGFEVKEMKLRDSIFIRRATGEMMLSREIGEIAKNHNAGLLIIGTYSPAELLTYVSVKAVRPENGQIVAAHDYALPNDVDVKRLLSLTIR
jgi:hypothetical protein